MESSKQLPRDVFLHLLMIIALGVSAVNFGTLLFQFVNVSVPDQLSGTYAVQSAHNLIRWSLASIVIAFPVLMWTIRFTHRDIAAHPEKRELKVRKWLLYLTLFIAGVVVLGDLIALVYNFLQGDLTLRFLLKIASVLIVAGSVFWYYLREARDAAFSGASARWAGRAAWAAVAIAVVAGFAIIGSPRSQRLARFDEQRVNDLQNIQWRIVSYWQNKHKLPIKLSDLRDDIGGFVEPVDPETGEEYQYQTTGALSFNLCANFETENNQAQYSARTAPVPMKGDITNSTWEHVAETTCFDRTVDPDIFPPR